MIDIKSYKTHGPDIPLSEHFLQETRIEGEFFEVRFYSLA